MTVDRTDGTCTACGALRAPWVNTWTSPAEREYFHPRTVIIGRECTPCYENRKLGVDLAPSVPIVVSEVRQ